MQLTTLRGSILEDAIPSTSRHGSTRGLPAKDILEHVCPELQLNALRLTLPGPKVGMVVTEVRKRLNYKLLLTILAAEQNQLTLGVQ